MKSRIKGCKKIHKRAVRKIDFWDESKGYHEVQLCVAYAKYVQKRPFLTDKWSNVTCEQCWEGKGSGVPDGIEEQHQREAQAFQEQLEKI